VLLARLPARRAAAAAPSARALGDLDTESAHEQVHRQGECVVVAHEPADRADERARGVVVGRASFACRLHERGRGRQPARRAREGRKVASRAGDLPCCGAGRGGDQRVLVFEVSVQRHRPDVDSTARRRIDSASQPSAATMPSAASTMLA